MRQQGDNQFIDLLNNVRVGSITKEDENLLKSRFISPNDFDYPHDALHIFAENSLVKEHNEIKLRLLSSPVITMLALDQYPAGVSPRTIEIIREKKLSDTGGLSYKLELKVGARVMLTSNIDIEDRLTNGQIGTVKGFEITNGKVEKVLVNFDDENAGKNLKLKSKARYNGVSIERTETKFNVTKRKSSGIVTRTQFPLVVAYAVTIHKVQGISTDEIVVSFQLERQRNFNAGQLYVALSRVRTFNGLFLKGRFSRSAIIASEAAHTEYGRLRLPENLLRPLRSFPLSESSLNISLLNVRSLNKHAKSLNNFEELITSDLLLLTETQLRLDYNCDPIKGHLSQFHLKFNNDVDKFKSLMFGYRENLNVVEIEKDSGFFLLQINKHNFIDIPFKVLLIYRSHQESMKSFIDTLRRFLEHHLDIDIILGDFNIDALGSSSDVTTLQSLISRNTCGYRQIINKPTHADGSLLDHVYVKENMFHLFDINEIKICVNISDHDALKINIKLKSNESGNPTC